MKLESTKQHQLDVRALVEFELGWIQFCIPIIDYRSAPLRHTLNPPASDGWLRWLHSMIEEHGLEDARSAIDRYVAERNWDRMESAQ